VVDDALPILRPCISGPFAKGIFSQLGKWVKKSVACPEEQTPSESKFMENFNQIKLVPDSTTLSDQNLHSLPSFSLGVFPVMARVFPRMFFHYRFLSIGF